MKKEGLGAIGDIMNRSEAAQMLRIPGRTLDYMVRRNEIPYIRLGKRALRFSRSRIARWLENRENIEYRIPRKRGPEGETGEER